MAKISYVNGRYVLHSEALVHIEDRGYQFSDGVYEYIAFYNRKLLDGDLHLRRLKRSLSELSIKPPVTFAALSIILRELIERNGREDGGIYIQISRGVVPRNHQFPNNVRASLVITIQAARTPKPYDFLHGVRCSTSTDIRWGRRDIKSISLLANVLAKQDAVSRGAREAWLVDEFIVTEGSASNAYIINKKAELVTHPANQLILGGIARDVLLRLAQKAGIKIIERGFSISDIKQAAEAFITSTSINVLPVVKIDDMIIGTGKPGSITIQLQELYANHIYKQTGKQF